MEEGNCCSKCGVLINSFLKVNQQSTNKMQNFSLSESEHYAKIFSEECSNNNSTLKPDKTDENLYGNIEISKSRKVVTGNVTYIIGPVYITQMTCNTEEKTITNQIYAQVEEINDLNIISRENWMAVSPKEVTLLPKPAKYVIIAHTATETGFNQPQNALLTKLIQTFHVESRGWADIGYNFLIGCDGNIYEGRGWNIQGAHTYGYNVKSVCIAFIGCFMDRIPPIISLNAARKLIMLGIQSGFISEDYTLIGHCQAIPSESPGVQLFNIIKKWPRWRELTPEDSKL